MSSIVVPLQAMPSTAPASLVAALLVDPGTPCLDDEVGTVLAAAEAHRVASLMYGRVFGDVRSAVQPATLRVGLRAMAARRAALELAQHAELAALLDRVGDDVLVLKGSALAYDVYEDASWRERHDVDLLVDRGRREAVRGRLLDAGYMTITEPTGERVSGQEQFARIDGHGVRHVCDLHWRLSNRARFASAFSFDELAAAAIALPRLSARARGLGRAHALWLACVHRAAHHSGDVSLLWLYDLHLLSRVLSADELAQFVTIVEATSTRRICADGLTRAGMFGTQLPPGAKAALDAPVHEPSAALLRTGLTEAHMLLDDLAATAGWRARARLVAEHLFPTERYMRTTYRPGSTRPLLWLYGRRLAAGAGKWLRRPS